MSILWRVIFFSRCTSTHHKLALDALRFVRGPHADLWANLLLSNHEQYLKGSKAPDNDFKDFKNHVLHVTDGFWGGATTAARQWYQKTVTALSQGDWPEASYNAGVLSHYFTDPFQPFHTGQTEAEGKVHRAAEWSICKSYEDLQSILEHDLGGFPEYELTARPDWLEEAIRQGAITAHESYDVCVEHYDLNRGIKDPPSGLDQEMKDRLARLIGLASVGFARVLERAFEESAASPPDVAVSLHVLLAGLKMPLNWVRKKFTDLHERAVIEAIYLEIQDKGKVVEALPEDERTVRKLYAQEVLKVPVRQLDAEPVRATGTQYGTGTPSRGETVKAASSASFQRTVISSPRQFDRPRGAVAPLEACLMVPLAKEAPPDLVADVAVNAYLKTQAPPPQTFAMSNPEYDTRSNAVAAVVERQSVPLAGPATDRGAKPAGLTSMRPTLAPLEAPSKSDLDKAERRLRRQLRQPADPEPELTPPSLSVPLPQEYQAPSTLTEMPVDMFAPLPPAPRVVQRENGSRENWPPAPSTLMPPETPSAAVPPVVAPSSVKPVSAKPAAVTPTKAAQPSAAVPTVPPVAPIAPVTPVAAVRPSPPVRNAAPPQPQATVPNRPVDAKTFSAQRAEQSVIPAPHVRLPELAEEQTAPLEIKNRLGAGGQTSGFEFQNFSGTKPSAPINPPLPSPIQKPHPAPVQSVPAPSPVVPRPAAVSQPPASQPLTSQPVTAPVSQSAVASKPATTRRFYLELESPVVDAPSIGPKTAERLQQIGIQTIADLLAADPGQAAERLGNRAATDLVREWQDQSRLVYRVPSLRGHDAQFLVACQVRTPERLRSREPQQLLQQVQTFLATTTGQRLLRGGTPPDLEEVTDWIAAAKEAR